MAGNISDFLSHIKDRGIAKTSHFDVRIWPVDVGFPSPDISQLLTLRCETAELPGRQIVTTDNKIYGPIYKVPYQTLYSEITMTFVDTAELDIRKFFEQWAQLIYDAETNTIGFVDDVVADMNITQYDQTGLPSQLNPVISFQLIRAFPTNINQLPTTWGDDAPHKLSVTFFYERYEVREFPIGKFPSVETSAELKELTNRYSGDVEYPEHEKINDVQINGMVRAEEEMNKTARNNQGLLGSLISDLKTKVTGSLPIEGFRKFL